MRPDRLDHLFRHCGDLRIDVEWTDLGETRHGQYEAQEDTITLSNRLTRRQTIATLAHELGHREFGDRCSSPPAERRAWLYAAAFLISPHEYRAAEALVGHQPGDLAAELDVTPKVIHAWRYWWQTRGHLLDLARSHSELVGETLEDF